jgi:hypothetical protein
LKARCKTYDQRLSGTQVPGIDYFNAQSEPLWPTNSAKGPQLRAMKNYYKSCAKNDSGCYGAPLPRSPWLQPRFINLVTPSSRSRVRCPAALVSTA